MSEAANNASADVGWLPAGESFAVWQLARLLNCHRQHLINLIESGEIKAFDFRGKGSSRSCVRVPRESVLKFLQTRQILATTGKKHSRKN